MSSEVGNLGQGTLIVSPTYNEHHNLAAHLSSVRRHAPGAHLLIVDDNSPDGTGRLADECAASDPAVHVLHRSGKLGLGTAYCAAFAWGLGRDYRSFVTMDADLSHQAHYLPSFFAELERGAAVVVGSRNMPGGSVEGWGLGRLFLSKGGSFYARSILGVKVRDMTTGFKAFTRQALEAIDPSSLRSNGYSFQIETVYRALRCGLRVVEVPIVFVDRREGKSKMDSRIFSEAVRVVWRLRWEAARGRL